MGERERRSQASTLQSLDPKALQPDEQGAEDSDGCQTGLEKIAKSNIIPNIMS